MIEKAALMRGERSSWAQPLRETAQNTQPRGVLLFLQDKGRALIPAENAKMNVDPRAPMTLSSEACFLGSTVDHSQTWTPTAASPACETVPLAVVGDALPCVTEEV